MSYVTKQQYLLNQHPLSNKVLVVEDNLIIQQVHQIHLEKLGYSVDTTDKGYCALSLHQKQRYTAILLDLRLPDTSGEYILSTIRNREEKTQIHTPIILVTAHGFLEDQMHYFKKGADAYLQKPISKEMLRNALHTLMQYK